ncbi:MAG: toxin [Marmoricola sp.]|nr:toxin [Marmoricola sp.]
MKIHPSALKHGISSEDAIQAAEWSLWIEPLDEGGPPSRELRLGFDTRTRLLETVVLVFGSGDEILIHAMPARKKYLDLLP